MVTNGALYIPLATHCFVISYLFFFPFVVTSVCVQTVEITYTTALLSKRDGRLYNIGLDGGEERGRANCDKEPTPR